jgi:hypothetical protein
MKTEDKIKHILPKIRQMAKRGTNAKLTELIVELYLAGVEEGMNALAKNLKERLHDNQSTNLSSDTSGVGGEPNSTVEPTS